MSGNPQDRPLVSVVTPFFDTEAYLAECIESVLAQTWERFEYVLVDNRSTDGSAAIARRYAERDSRIRLLSADRHRPQLANFNYALRQISGASRYCKMVLADDWLYPECLERMVAVAEAHPAVVLVGAYYLAGERVEAVGLAPQREVFEGREVARRQLLEGDFFLGSPSTVLYRSERVRSRDPFFDPEALHADTKLGYELLREGDVGFVHQVLAYMRTGNESISTGVRHLAPHGLDKLIVILRHGRQFLDDSEYRCCLDRHLERYARGYVGGLLGSERRTFRSYHRDALASVGYRIPRSVLARAVAIELADLVLNPKKTVGRLLGRLRLREAAR